MTDERKTQLRGKALWASLAREPDQTEQIDGWDANLLAGFLDGTLSDREREMLEAKLAEEPMLLDTLVAAHGGEPAESGPPPELIDAARQVGRDGGRSSDKSSGGGRPKPANENRRGTVWLEWAAAAAAIMVVSAVGFELGSDTGRQSAKLTGAKSPHVVAKRGGNDDLGLDANFFATGFTLDEADDAFNGDE